MNTFFEEIAWGSVLLIPRSIHHSELSEWCMDADFYSVISPEGEITEGNDPVTLKKGDRIVLGHLWYSWDSSSHEYQEIIELTLYRVSSVSKNSANATKVAFAEFINGEPTFRKGRWGNVHDKKAAAFLSWISNCFCG
jgi:hypothetical protein